MAESVQTGGIMQFKYPGQTPKLKEAYRKEIDEAYEVYYERKKEEKKRKKILYWLLAILGLVAIAIIFLLLNK